MKLKMAITIQRTEQRNVVAQGLVDVRLAAGRTRINVVKYQDDSETDGASLYDEGRALAAILAGDVCESFRKGLVDALTEDAEL